MRTRRWDELVRRLIAPEVKFMRPSDIGGETKALHTHLVRAELAMLVTALRYSAHAELDDHVWLITSMNAAFIINCLPLNCVAVMPLGKRVGVIASAAP